MSFRFIFYDTCIVVLNNHVNQISTFIYFWWNYIVYTIRMLGVALEERSLDEVSKIIIELINTPVVVMGMLYRVYIVICNVIKFIRNYQPDETEEESNTLIVTVPEDEMRTDTYSDPNRPEVCVTQDRREQSNEPENYDGYERRRNNDRRIAVFHISNLKRRNVDNKNSIFIHDDEERRKK